MMSWTKVREKTAAIATILFIIVFGVVIAQIAGYRIPVISNILDAFGIG